MHLDDVYADILPLVSAVGADISVPSESELFFSSIVDTYTGTKEDLLVFIRNNLHTWFVSLNNAPHWIQNPEWPFDRGHPMVFVGQLEVSAHRGYFHDDAVFYLFWSPGSGETKTVVQVR